MIGNEERIINEEDGSIRIFESDSEEIRKIKRGHNTIASVIYHQRGAESLPTGIPKNCKVEQPRAQGEHISTPTYVLGDQQYTNGLTRNLYINGHNKFTHKMGFAGRAHKG